jgi:c-di-GMP-binding flagellar brake protein YcgR
MMGANIFLLFPLQFSASDFQFGSGTSVSSTGLIIFASAIVLIIVFFIIMNAVKGASGSGGGSGSSGGGSKLFAGLALRRLAGNIGLDNEQAKMLEFIFRTDGVTEPEKSINTPDLLDRHFRRAYREIEQKSGSGQDAQDKFSVLFSTRNLLENCIIGGLTSTRELGNDITLGFNHGRDKIHVNVVNAKTELLIVEVPKSVLGSQIKIPKGTRLNVLFFTKNNKGFSFETRVTGYSTINGHPIMQLAHSNHLRFLSQRRFRRRHAVIACLMYLVYLEGSGKKQRLVVDKRRLTGNIADISVGGCSIKTTTPVQVGARFKIEFTQGESSVAGLGQVLRTNRTGVNTIIHVKFLKLSQKSMNIINAYVYEYAHE